MKGNIQQILSVILLVAAFAGFFIFMFILNRKANK